MIFTAGGTESDNLAVKGIFWARRDAAPSSGALSPRPSSTTPCSMRSSGWSSMKALR